MTNQSTHEEVVAMFTEKEVQKHYEQAMKCIKSGYSAKLMNFYYQCSLLYKLTDQAEGRKRAMLECNMDIEEKMQPEIQKAYERFE